MHGFCSIFFSEKYYSGVPVYNTVSFIHVPGMFLFLYLFVLIIFVSSDRSGEHATKHTLFFCREPGRGVTLKPSTKTLKKDVIFSVRAEIPTLRFFSFSFGLSRTMAPSSLYVTCALLGRWVKIRLEFHTSSAKYICVA